MDVLDTLRKREEELENKIRQTLLAYGSAEGMLEECRNMIRDVEASMAAPENEGAAQGPSDATAEAAPASKGAQGASADHKD